MGVHGLWKLLEAAGKPVPLETLENKVLAVDVSIWLHQMMKGYQDSRGAPVPNAHLLGLFHRVCKLLYYRIKPVFVFDGGVPLLKRQTIAARKSLKMQASQNAANTKEKLLKNLVKRKAVRQMLHGSQGSSETPIESSSKDDIFHLPPIPNETLNSDSEEESLDRLQTILESNDSGSESDPESKSERKPSSQQLLGHKLDLHTLDVNCEEFSSLPPDVRHDILSELKETRKQNSWGRLHEMPEESGDFSSYQLGRLLKRRGVQCAMEKAEKEMGGKVMRMSELQELMTAQGVNIIEESELMQPATRRIASDSATRFVLCKDPPSAPSQSSQSSQSVSVSEKTEDKSLYNEQVEFIAQMAENMLQKIKEKKQGIKINTVMKETYDTLEEEIDTFGGEKSTSAAKSNAISEEKILADSWSSDDEITLNSEMSVVSTDSKSVEISKRAGEVFLRNKMDDSKNSENQKSVTLQYASTEKNLVELSTDSKAEAPEVSELPEVVTASNREFLSSALKLANENLGQAVSCSNSLSASGKVGDESSWDGHTDAEELAESSGDGHTDAEELAADTASLEGISSKILMCPEKKPTDSEYGKYGKTSKIDFKELELPVNQEKALGIGVCSGASPDEIFDDFFETNEKSGNVRRNDKKTDSLIEEKKALQIVINPIADTENDMFADIFQGHHEVSKAVKVEVMSDSESEESESPSMDKSPLKIDSQTVRDSQATKVFKSTEIESKEAKLESSLSTHTQHSKSSTQESYDSVISSFFSEPVGSTTDWNEMEASLGAEQLVLQKERGRQERLAASITDQMCLEAQELLQLFGLPFIVAPMEAEAQCAFLDAISLTEGSITDDSDIWLFGGKKVYKNFFNQKKHVLQFTSANINHYFKLTREQLVQFALLVGSDYTTGIQGIGPVTALEIVAAFQSRMESDSVQCALKGMSQFKDWWNSGHPRKSNRMRLLEKKLKNVKFAEGFPSQAVVEAYIRPSVDDSQDTFSWGTLDLPALRDYARSKFGWTASKTDEILLPVAKRWTARSSQRSLDSYFNLQPQLVEGLSKMSKRVQKAVTLMESDADSEDIDDPSPKTKTREIQKQGKKKIHTSIENLPKKARTNEAELSFSGNESDCERNASKQNSKSKTGKRITDTLPFRAPTVPRQRTSIGVRRIGLKSNKSSGGIELAETSRPSSKVPISSEDSPSIGLNSMPSEQPNFGSDSNNEECNVKRKPQAQSKSKAKKSVDRPCRTSSVPCERNSREVKTVRVKSTKKSPCASNVDIDSQPCGSGASGSPRGFEGSEEVLEPRPSTSQVSESHGVAHVPYDLAALSEMDWEDDPWSVETSENMQECKPKVFFGGVRPNKPRKPTRSRPVDPVPVQGNDSRGMRPGWLTRERIESRTAWVNVAAQKTDDSIPQRERDQRAMEAAKMKAISVIKATDAKQASRLLGRSQTKRGKGKVRAKGKILPQHNLSESSSDEEMA